MVNIMCISSCFNYAYLAAFRMHKDLNPKIMDLWWFYEIVFFLDMVFQFFKEYTSETTNLPVRDLGRIAGNYLENGLVTDAIALVPFQVLNLKNRRENLFFLIKLVRLGKGLRLFDVTAIMK